MPTFTLNASFDQDSLSMLYATGTNVVVAKPNGGGSPNVAWIVFRPLQANSLTWEEQYGIYASTSAITNGATLSKMSATGDPAASGQVYTMLPAGFFGLPESGGSPNSYTAVNTWNNLPPGGPGYLTMGLYQSATVNGSSLIGNAVSAAPVLYQSTATMTPFTTVYIWTQSQVASNTVVTNVTSVQTKAVFGGSVTDITLAYDPTSGGFITLGSTLQSDATTGKLIASGGDKLPDGLSLEYLLPTLG